MTSTESRSTVLLAAALVVVVLIASPAAAITSTEQDTDTLELEIEEGEEDGTIEVYLSSWLPNVAGVEAEIEYDPDVVQFEGAESVDLGGILNVNEDYGEDSLFLSHAVAKSDAVDEPTMNKLTFEIVGDGEAAFEVVDDESTVFEVVEVDGDQQLAENSVSTMPLTLSTDELGEDETDGSDGATDDDSTGGDGDSAGGEQTDGDSGDGSDQQSTDGGSADEGTSSDGTDSGSSSSDSDGTAGETDEATSESADERPAGDDSSELISGIGLLAVVSGFLFAVAILARDQM